MNFEEQYSGDNSRKFWDAINKLDEPEKSELYFAGVLLQNMEDSILRVLNNAIEEQK